MVTNKLAKIMCLVAAASLFAACGGDTTPSANNENDMMTDTDMTMDKKDESGDMMMAKCEAAAPTCDGDTAVVETAMTDDTGMCVKNSAKTDCTMEGKVCKDGACVAGGMTMTRDAPKCTDAMPPARCAVAPDMAMFGHASVASKLELLASDADCCFDYTGDGKADNGLGQLLSIQGDLLGDANSGIKDSIENGTIALVFEHIGLEALADADFTMGFLLGEPEMAGTGPKPEGGNKYKVNPASFGMGSYPQAVAAASLKGTNVTAGPGSITLEIALFGIKLNLVITAAQIEAEVDSGNSALDGKGVALKDGKLGGLVRVEDIFGAINEFTSTNCSCYGLTDNNNEILDYTPGMLDSAACRGDMTTAAGCDDMDEIQGICKTIVEDVCQYVSVISLTTDVDSTNIGKDCNDPAAGLTCDAISLGIKFDAVGAQVTGVLPPQ